MGVVKIEWTVLVYTDSVIAQQISTYCSFSTIGWGPYIQNGLLSSVSVNTFKDTLRLCFHGNSKSNQVDQED